MLLTAACGPGGLPCTREVPSVSATWALERSSEGSGYGTALLIDIRYTKCAIWCRGPAVVTNRAGEGHHAIPRQASQ